MRDYSNQGIDRFQSSLRGLNSTRDAKVQSSSPAKNAFAAQASTFHAQLQKSLGQRLTFSMHAADRMKQRNITLSAGDMDRISQAVDEAAKKGGKDLLLVYKNTAFVVSVPNKTVVTAVDGASMKSNVFTQIDSAMVL